MSRYTARFGWTLGAIALAGVAALVASTAFADDKPAEAKPAEDKDAPKPAGAPPMVENPPAGIKQNAMGMSQTTAVDQTATYELRVIDASETGAELDVPGKIDGVQINQPLDEFVDIFRGLRKGRRGIEQAARRGEPLVDGGAAGQRPPDDGRGHGGDAPAEDRRSDGGPATAH